MDEKKKIDKNVTSEEEGTAMSVLKQRKDGDDIVVGRGATLMVLARSPTRGRIDTDTDTSGEATRPINMLECYLLLWIPQRLHVTYKLIEPTSTNNNNWNSEKQETKEKPDDQEQRYGFMRYKSGGKKIRKNMIPLI
jgi:hypothetical protein